MADANGQRRQRNRDGWRRLRSFWLATLALTATGTGVVQWLGAPQATHGLTTISGEKATGPVHREAAPTRDAAMVPAADKPKAVTVTAAPIAVTRLAAGRDTPGPIVDPDPSLLEPAATGSKDSLPRVASDGRTPMQVYAAGFDRSSRRPRVGLLMAGIGLNDAESDAAIRTLPGAVSLAISPYATNLSRLLATARTIGHEYLIAVPLEPAGFPLNDPGPSTLLTSLPVSVNAQNLRWALSRIDGYVGATGVIGTMRGERLAEMTDQMEPVLTEFSDRGLLYVDPREQHGPIPKTWGRHADLVIDDPLDGSPVDRATIDARLAALEQYARDNGSALGLVMRPMPVTIGRIAAWSNGLVDRGLTLAPVSALVLPPGDAAVKLSERRE